MAQPLRKIFQKNLLSGGDASASQGRRERAARAEGSGRARLAENRRLSREARPSDRPPRTLNLSAAATAALALALVAAVGWSFFMGYMVGRGEDPERGVESVAGLLLPGSSPSADAAGAAGALPGAEALAPAPDAPPAGGAPLQPVAPGAEPRTASGAIAPAGAPPVAAAGAPGVPGAPGSAASGDGVSAPAVPAASSAPAYPFSRPQGESLAAWGIREGQAPTPSDRQPGAPGPVASAPSVPADRPGAAASERQPVEPRFDHVFQAAAFRGPADAERLRGRLEEAGLRARVRQSGKVRLVLVSVRGSARDADRVRGELAAMGLGRPILLEKKPVAEKTGGKGRRRSGR